MTTHLHPEDNLPISAVPICDSYTNCKSLNWNTAEYLERRARKVEAQLAVAVQALKDAIEMYEIAYAEPCIIPCREALAEIAAIGGVK